MFHLKKSFVCLLFLSSLLGASDIQSLPKIEEKEWKSVLSQSTPLQGNFLYATRWQAARPEAAPFSGVMRGAWCDDALFLSLELPAPLTGTGSYVEFATDPNRGGQSSFNVRIYGDGSMKCDWNCALDYVMKNWESEVISDIRTTPEGRCEYRVRIPFAKMGTAPGKGDIIGVSFSVAPAPGKGKASHRITWPSYLLYWSWWERREVPDPFGFAALKLDGEEENIPLKFLSTSRGAMLGKSDDPRNTFVGEVENTSSEEQECTLLLSRVNAQGQSETVMEEIFQVPPKTKLPVRMRYPAEHTVLEFSMRWKEKSFYTSRLIGRYDPPKRMYDKGGAFKKELVEKVSDPLAKKGFLIYPQHLKGNEFAHANSMAYAYEYDLEQTVSRLAPNKELSHMTVRTGTEYNHLPARAGLLRRFGAKVAYYARPQKIGVKQPGGLASLPHWVPRTENARTDDEWGFLGLPSEALSRDYLQALREDLTEYADLIEIVVFEDEFDYQLLKALTTAFSTEKSRQRNPMIDEINADIRTRFGNGRYGLWNASTPPEELAYCKIATHRWLNEYVAELNRAMAAEARKLKPGVLIMGDDPQNVVFPYDYSRRWDGVVDIVLHQTMDKPLVTDVGTGVIVKYLRDVLSVEEIWPCVHVEGTPSLFTLEETREEFSRAFRSGATGIAYYNLCWGGALGIRDEIGAPERWRYLLQMTDFYAQGNRAKLPEKTPIGVFFSNYSTLAANWARNMGQIYLCLGPEINGYFRYIDNFALARGEVPLNGYKAIFAPHIEVECVEAVQALDRAVRENGTTLVIADQDPLRSDEIGQAHPFRKQWLGDLEISAKNEEMRVTSAGCDGLFSGLPDVVCTQSRKLKNTDCWETLLRYSDGSPAAVSKTAGKGRIIFLAFNPFAVRPATLPPNAPLGFDYGDKPVLDPNLGSVCPELKDFMTGMVRALGGRTDYDIWQLKVPAPQTGISYPEDGCLTSNAIFWAVNRPHTEANMPVSGKIRFSVAPENKSWAPDVWMPMDGNELFDRHRALLDGKKPADCVLRWNGVPEMVLEIDLGYRAAFSRLVLFRSGKYGPFRVETSPDGRVWKTAAEVTATGDVEGTAATQVALKGTDGRFLRLAFRAPPGKKLNRMTLCELELWGKTEK